MQAPNYLEKFTTPYGFNESADQFLPLTRSFSFHGPDGRQASVILTRYDPYVSVRLFTMEGEHASPEAFEAVTVDGIKPQAKGQWFNVPLILLQGLELGEHPILTVEGQTWPLIEVW